MGILEICGDVFNCQNVRGTQVMFIGWISEMPNSWNGEMHPVPKKSNKNKNCPAFLWL